VKDLFVAALKHVGHYGLWVAIAGGLVMMMAGAIAAGGGRRR